MINEYFQQIDHITFICDGTDMYDSKSRQTER